MRAGEANASARNDDAHGAGRHGENVLPLLGTSNHVRNSAILAVPSSRHPTRWKLFGEGAEKGGRGARAPRVLLELCYEMGTLRFSTLMLLVTSTDITVWIVSAVLALGIGVSKYAKWKARDQLVRELAAMDRERREKLLSRMNPAQAMEARQELMRRFNIF